MLTLIILIEVTLCYSGFLKFWSKEYDLYGYVY